MRSVLFLALLTSLLLSGSLTPSRADDKDSWVGKNVMPKKAGIKIRNTGENREEVDLTTLTAIIVTVLEEKGQRIKVRQNTFEGWFAKEDAVLLEDAVNYFTQCIQANPKDDYAYAHRAFAWGSRSEIDRALKDYDEAIRLAPKMAQWRCGRGNAWFDKQQYDKAIKDYDEAIHLDPKYATAFNNRANTWKAKKGYDKAIKDYDEAIRLDPKNIYPLSAQAYLLATCTEDKFRDGKKALELATQVCELTKWKDGWALMVLAAAHAELGQFDDAIKWQKKAMEYTNYANDEEEKAKAEKRLKQYEQKKPWRED